MLLIVKYNVNRSYPIIPSTRNRVDQQNSKTVVDRSREIIRHRQYMFHFPRCRKSFAFIYFTPVVVIRVSYVTNSSCLHLHLCLLNLSFALKARLKHGSASYLATSLS